MSVFLRILKSDADYATAATSHLHRSEITACSMVRAELYHKIHVTFTDGADAFPLVVMQPEKEPEAEVVAGAGKWAYIQLSHLLQALSSDLDNSPPVPMAMQVLAHVSSSCMCSCAVVRVKEKVPPAAIGSALRSMLPPTHTHADEHTHAADGSDSGHMLQQLQTQTGPYLPLLQRCFRSVQQQLQQYHLALTLASTTADGISTSSNAPVSHTDALHALFALKWQALPRAVLPLMGSTLPVLGAVAATLSARRTGAHANRDAVEEEKVEISVWQTARTLLQQANHGLACDANTRATLLEVWQQQLQQCWLPLAQPLGALSTAVSVSDVVEPALQVCSHSFAHVGTLVRISVCNACYACFMCSLLLCNPHLSLPQCSTATRRPAGELFVVSAGAGHGRGRHLPAEGVPRSHAGHSHSRLRIRTSVAGSAAGTVVAGSRGHQGLCILCNKLQVCPDPPKSYPGDLLCITNACQRRAHIPPLLRRLSADTRRAHRRAEAAVHAVPRWRCKQKTLYATREHAAASPTAMADSARKRATADLGSYNRLSGLSSADAVAGSFVAT